MTAFRVIGENRHLFTVLLLALVLAACSEPAPTVPASVDTLCTSTPMNAASEKGNAAILVSGADASYFYVLDAGGKQIAYAQLGKPARVPAGTYQLKLNNSVHGVSVAAGTQLSCASAGVLVSGATDEYYYVFDGQGQQLHYNTLGKPLALLPGDYKVAVNKTEAAVTLTKNEQAVVATGSLLVSGTTDEYYYVFDANGRQLHYNTLGKALSFLPGAYKATVNKTEQAFDISAGAQTGLSTASLLVSGATGEYYYVFDGSGKQLHYQTLNKPLAFFAGTYKVQLNKTEAEASLSTGELSKLSSGAVVVKGATDEYWYVFNPAGLQLHYQMLNKALSLFPGAYLARVNKTEAPAEVAADKLTELLTGSVLVKGDGQNYYYVHDRAGQQLHYQNTGKALSLFPGNYEVKSDKRLTPISVTAGGQSTL